MTELMERPELISPLVLAYLGDSVYEVHIRSYLVSRHKTNSGNLHRLAKNYVCAAAQSAIIGVIEPMLTENETAIYKRGRNANPPTVPKHANLSDYRRATGFEALIGYLYLKGDNERLAYLLDFAVKSREEK